MMESRTPHKKWAWGFLLVLLGAWVGFASLRSFAASSDDDSNSSKKKKIVYRSHTQLDFSGETVQGKVRAPEVFYIFQRKRSESHHVVQTPVSFDYHAPATQDGLTRELADRSGGRASQ